MSAEESTMHVIRAEEFYRLLGTHEIGRLGVKGGSATVKIAHRRLGPLTCWPGHHSQVKVNRPGLLGGS